MARKILHLDLDAFFCAVEEKLDPELKGKPFATGGSPEGRGVVSSCSYAARVYGIHSAMPMKQALRLYPKLIVVQGHYKEYIRQSKLVMEIIKNLSPLVEQISIDEAFLDVSDLSESAERIASDLQMKIYSELKLPCSIGVAANKLVAKIANNIGKSRKKSPQPPMAITVVPSGKEIEFLAPLKVNEMWGIGPKIAGELNELGIQTIGDILKYPDEILKKRIGTITGDLINRAKGIDYRPVAEYEGIKSISNEVTFFKDLKDKKELYLILKSLSEKTGLRLRRKKLNGKTVKIKIRWPDFETHTRQITLPQPTNQDSVIYRAAKTLFDDIWEMDKSVRLIGVGVSQLSDELQQLNLFDRSYQKENDLLRAIDELHERFGEKSVQKGMNSANFRSWKN